MEEIPVATVDLVIESKKLKTTHYFKSKQAEVISALDTLSKKLLEVKNKKQKVTELIDEFKFKVDVIDSLLQKNENASADLNISIDDLLSNVTKIVKELKVDEAIFSEFDKIIQYDNKKKELEENGWV